MAVGYAGSDTPLELRDRWRTPEYAFLPLHDEFDFQLDVAAEPGNALLPRFITPEEDALSVCWADRLPDPRKRAVWCNPPYSDLTPWLDKAWEEAEENGVVTVMLIPHTPDAGWWPAHASEVRVVTGVRKPRGRNVSGRIQFLRADTGKPGNSNNKGSCYVIFAPGTLGVMATRYVPITYLFLETDRIKGAMYKEVANV